MSDEAWLRVEGLKHPAVSVSLESPFVVQSETAEES